jgi:hypothetical protein
MALMMDNGIRMRKPILPAVPVLIGIRLVIAVSKTTTPQIRKLL